MQQASSKTGQAGNRFRGRQERALRSAGPRRRPTRDELVGKEVRVVAKTKPRKKRPAIRTTDRDNGLAPPQPKAEMNKWTFFTNHAHVLILLYIDANVVLREIAAKVGITERAVQRIVQDLEDGGFIERERVGRRNRYHVLRDKYLRHPIESHCKINDLIKFIVDSK